MLLYKFFSVYIDSNRVKRAVVRTIEVTHKVQLVCNTCLIAFLSCSGDEKPQMRNDAKEAGYDAEEDGRHCFAYLHVHV